MTTKRNSFVSDVSALLDTEIGEGVTAFMGDVAESSDVDYIDVATDTETATENESKIKKPYITTSTTVGSCVLYTLCSVSMVLVNKSLASR